MKRQRWQEHRRSREISLLYEAGKQLGRTLDLGVLHDTVHEVVSSLMSCDSLLVSAYHAEDNLIRCVYSRHEGKQVDVSGFPPIPLEPEGKGTQSLVIRSGEPLYLPNYQSQLKTAQTAYYTDKDGNVLEKAPEEGDVVRSALIVPLKLENKVLGVIQVFSYQKNAYTDENLQILLALGPQIAAATANAHLYQQAQTEIMERKRAETAEREQRVFAETLSQSIAVLNSSLSLDQVLLHILEQLQRTIPYDSASVQERQGDELIVRAIRGWDNGDELLKVRFPLVPKHPNTHVISQRTTLAIDDIGQVYSVFQQEKEYRASHIRSWLGVPLVVGEEVIGMIALDRHEIRPYTPEEIERATLFAHHAAIALHNARLYQELAVYSQTMEQLVEKRTQELKRTMERAETILQNSPDAMLLLKTDGTIETVNWAFYQLFDYFLNQPYDQHPQALFTPSHTHAFIQALQDVVRTGEVKRLELLAQRRDGTVFDAGVALSPIKEERGVVGVVCGLRDISGLKEVERLKDTFVSNVSHELRTPITSLKLHHDLMRLNPKKQEVYIERMGREIDRLNRIVEDLLHLSQLEQGKIQLNWQWVDLNRLTAEYIQDRHPLFEAKNLTLTLHQADNLPLVWGDEGLLGEVLTILLSNARNYTPDNGRVTVTTYHHPDEKVAGFRVSDTGPGIPPHEQPHIFARFYRGTIGRDSGTAGTGLGLSIARQIMDEHRGHITLVSEGISGQGATFIVSLPAFPSGTVKPIHNLTDIGQNR